MFFLRHLFDHDVDSGSLQLRGAVEAFEADDGVIVSLRVDHDVLLCCVEPWVVESLLGSDSIAWILDKHLQYKVFQVGAKIFWDLGLLSLDVGKQFVM